MRQVLLKVLGVLSLLSVIIISCLLIGQDQQKLFEEKELGAFKTEKIDSSYTGLVSHCSLGGGAEALEGGGGGGGRGEGRGGGRGGGGGERHRSEMMMAVAVISAPNQLSRRQV